MNADLKTRQKGMDTLQGEVDSMKMALIEFQNKEINLQRFVSCNNVSSVFSFDQLFCHEVKFSILVVPDAS